MKVYPDIQSKYLVWFLLTYWFVQVISQGLRITPECLGNPLMIVEANDDIYLDSFSDSYLHPFTWRIYWHWNYTVFDFWIFFCEAFGRGSWFTRHFKPRFDWYWKPGLNLLTSKPVTRLLDPKEVGGSLTCPSLSFKKPLQAGDTPRGSRGEVGQGPRLMELTAGTERPQLLFQGLQKRYCADIKCEWSQSCLHMS